MSAPVTLSPVTLGGWYEHTDGTVGRYVWTGGVLHLAETVAGWAETTTDADRYEAEDRDREATTRGE